MCNPHSSKFSPPILGDIVHSDKILVRLGYCVVILSCYSKKDGVQGGSLVGEGSIMFLMFPKSLQASFKDSHQNNYLGTLPMFSNGQEERKS